MALQLSIRERVAQQFLLGTDSEHPEGMLTPFMKTGLGGFLGFRHNFQRFSSAYDLKNWLTTFQNKFKGAGLSFSALDEEGGQVSRLPHWLFPSGCNALHIGLKNDLYLAERIVKEQAQRLRWLGFNLNFAPVLDCNTQMANPIIGVRSFGQNKDLVTQFATIFSNAYWQAGIFAVGKHFPGHGSGTVDSHVSLPVFDNWHPDELLPFQSVIKKNIPGILTAHGIYPLLQKELSDTNGLPASLSPSIISGLLKENLGFSGLVFTDDLSMGALNEFGDPVEQALLAIEAGADILVWRMTQNNQEGIYQAFETLVKAYENGKLSEKQLDETVTKILQSKSFMAKQPLYDYPEAAWTREACHQQSLQWHQDTSIVFKNQMPSPLPLDPMTSWALVAPDPAQMIHYASDVDTENTFDFWNKQFNLSPKAINLYNPFTSQFTGQSVKAENTFPTEVLDVIVFVAFNSLLYPHQQEYYQRLQQQHPTARILLVSIGMPTDGDILTNAWAHLALPSYRPAAIDSLYRWLTL